MWVPFCQAGHTYLYATALADNLGTLAPMLVFDRFHGLCLQRLENFTVTYGPALHVQPPLPRQQQLRRLHPLQRQVALGQVLPAFVLPSRL